MKTIITIIDTEYQNSHMKPPSGRGSWAFKVIDETNGKGVGDLIWTPSLTYADAKAWAKSKVRELFPEETQRGMVGLSVQP